VPALASRRELVRGGLAAAAALASPARALAAAGGATAPAEPLAQALAVEQLTVIAYRRTLGSGVLRREQARTVAGLLGHELEHVAALERALRGLGGVAPAPPSTVAAAQAALKRHQVALSLTRLHTPHAYLRLLIEVETIAEGAYFTAITKLEDPALLRLCAGAMGCEAQHWTVLSALQHAGEVSEAVPYPFVRGSIGY
jgi:hypothetical protein